MFLAHRHKHVYTTGQEKNLKAAKVLLKGFNKSLYQSIVTLQMDRLPSLYWCKFSVWRISSLYCHFWHIYFIYSYIFKIYTSESSYSQYSGNWLYCLVWERLMAGNISTEMWKRSGWTRELQEQVQRRIRLCLSRGWVVQNAEWTGKI